MNNPITARRRPGEGVAIASLCLTLVMSTTARAEDVGQLQTAVETGNLQGVVELVSANPERVTAEDRLGKLPLHYAAAAGQAEIVTFLLKHGADVMARDHRGWTALHYAAENGHVDVIELLLARGAEVNAANLMNWTPLHQAVLRRQTDAVLALIKEGADVFAETSRNLTAYALALENGDREVAAHLMAAMEAVPKPAAPAALAVRPKTPVTIELTSTREASAN